MNSIQVHLMLNHLPSIGQIIGLIIFIFGWMRASEILRKTGAIVMLASALFILPVSRSGELAEERIENIQGISENQIEIHEDAAGRAWVMTVITGVVAILWLVISAKKPTYSQYASAALMLCAITSVILVLLASHEGGLIRHPELQGEVNPHKPAEIEDDE